MSIGTDDHIVEEAILEAGIRVYWKIQIHDEGLWGT